MDTTNDPPPTGLLLLSQPGQLGITLREMTDALPEAYRSLPRQAIDVDMLEIARQAVQSGDWGAAQHTLDKLFREKLEPLASQYPDYRLVYFGSAPIGLAIKLGFLLETWQRVEVVPHHHGRRAWGWRREPGQPPARLAPLVLPDYRDHTAGEAVIRVSTSHAVDPHVTRLSAPTGLVEIDISLEHPAEDAFTCLEEMQKVALAFRKALDTIGDKFPGIHRVHLFASVQPGMALLLGAQISKSMHPAVQTYQYTRNAENAPLHVPALLINGPSRAEAPPLTEEQQAQAGRDRAQLEKDLERMKGFAARERKTPPESWIASVATAAEQASTFSGGWLDLPMLHATPLRQTKMDVSTQTVADTFRLSPSNEWQIDDHWLERLARRLPTDARRHRALRMLVLHESAHRGPQGLTRTSSQGVGRFPKVLEEMDYHADVWAMLHEHTLTSLQSPSEVEPPQEFFKEMILVATETMWAFDDDGPPLREIQVRRLNRYLIWYWQYLLLERGSERGQAMTLDAVLSVLAQRPLIELAGPTVLAHDERVFFALDTVRVNVPELAIYHQGRLFRHGPRFDFSITALLDGARTRDGEKILDVLRAAVEQTVR